LCGFFVCEYLRACRKYPGSYKELKEARDHWHGIVEKATDENRFKRTVGDICKFIMDQVVHEGQPYFLTGTEYATEPQYEPLRKWDSLLRDELRDYQHPVTF